MTLRDLKVGQSARIKAVGGEGELRQHFLDMGVIPGAELTLVKLAPMGDPMEFQIHGYELTLRLADAEQIDAEQIETRSRAHTRVEIIEEKEHPGLGEEGKYHVKGDGVQSAHRIKSAYRQFPWSNCRQKRWSDKGQGEYFRDGSAWNIFDVSL